MEIINSVKFITDVNHSDEIELVLEHMSAVYVSVLVLYSFQIGFLGFIRGEFLIENDHQRIGTSQKISKIE